MRTLKLIPFAMLAGACALSAVSILGSSTLVAQQVQQPGQILKQFGPRAGKPVVGAPQPGQTAGQAAGQPAAAPKQSAKIVGKHKDWTITCDEKGTPQPDGTTKKPCAMLQRAQHAERKRVALTLVFLKGVKDGKPNTMMRVIAPVGVYLPTGVALEIDGEPVGRVPFTRCLPQACIAFAEASPPTLEKMKKGGKANFIIYEGPGLSMAVEFSLNGFTAGLNNLHEL